MKSISKLDLKLLRYLLRHPNTHYSELEKQLEISRPTVAKHLTSLEKLLAEDQQGAHMVRSKNAGISISGNSAALLAEIEQHIYQEPETAQERQQLILAWLLFGKNKVHIQTMTQKLYVSERTVESDLVEIRAILEKFQGVLFNRSGELSLQMSAKNLNSLMIAFFKNCFKQVAGDKEKFTELPKPLSQFFSNKTLQQVSYQINAFLNSFDLKAADNEYFSLVFFLLIQLTLYQNTINTDEKVVLNLEPETINLVIQLENNLLYQLSEKQQKFVNVLVILIKVENCKDLPANELAVIKQISALIYKEQPTFKPDVLDAFAKHVFLALNRAKIGMTVTSPYTNYLKRNYPTAFDRALNLTAKLKQCYGIGLSDDEISLIATYYESQVEDQHSQRKRVPVTIICSNGFGTSRLLAEKIALELGNKLYVKQILNLHELTEQKIPTQEIVLSTIPLINLDQPYLQVTPFLTSADKGNIERYIDKQLDRQRNLSYLFIDLFDPSLIIDLPKKQDVQVGLKTLVSSAIDQKKASVGLFESAYRREKLSTTAISQIALPHGDPQYIKKPFIGVLKSKKGINWLGEHVKLAFFMGLKQDEPQQFRKIYSELNYLLSSDKVLKQLIEADDSETFLQIIRKEHRSYERNFE